MTEFKKEVFEDEKRIKELQAWLDAYRKIEEAVVKELRALVYKIERQ